MNEPGGHECVDEEKNYRKEIAKLARKRLHAAFVVLDPRQEMEFAKGITWFFAACGGSSCLSYALLG